MRIEIDTGSRLDQSGDTTFALSDDIQRAVLLRQTVRDECLDRLPGKRLKRQLRLFAACIYLLIKNHIKEIEEIQIDREYPGHENEIRWILFSILKRHFPVPELQISIEFEPLGKKSRAHEIALRTLRKARDPDQILSPWEILSSVLK